MNNKKILNTGEVICWYCKNSCNANKCALYDKKLKNKLKLSSTSSFKCPCFEQDVPFPLTKDEIAQKCGYDNFKRLKYVIISYITTEKKLSDLEHKLEAFGYWGRYLKPLDYITMTPREFFWKYMRRAYEKYELNCSTETNSDPT